MSLLKTITLSVAMVALAACGGGGGGSSTPTPPPAPTNQAPTANAGADQSVDEGATVSLSGSGSDSDGSIASYAWSQASGTSVTLSATDTATTSFTAPSTNSSETIVLTLTVTDDDGATGSDTVSITVNTTNQAPAADAGADQTVTESDTVNLDASASSDADGSITAYSWSQVSGPSATLSGATTATPSFTAPGVSSTQALVFEVSVTDDRDATDSAQVTITVNADPTLNEIPVVSFTAPDNAVSGETVTLDGSSSSDNDGTIVSYSWTQLSGPAVTITSSSQAIASFVAPTVMSDEVISIALEVTDNEGAVGTVAMGHEITISPAPAGATISGKVTYDNVPHNANNSLNYNGITQDPVRGALVELLEGATVVGTTVTDGNGDYSIVAENNKNVMIRVKAQMLQTATQSWDVQVVDNTNGGALYVLDSSAIATGSQTAITRNLHAASGWGGSSYTSTRAAAPFHILDRVYDIVEKLKAVDTNLTLSRLLINWSPNNVAQQGNKSLGQITTSHYTNSNIFLLGAANSDTDEYDGHVIIHEWGHYFEDNNARSDSIGGSHGGGDRLDMRVAFGEGFGNAWSGIITDDPSYRDSFGNSQSQGFVINVDNNNNSNPGWFSEGSVQSILYDIYDSTNDGSDSISLGLQPIYDVLVGKQRNTEALTSIFSFMTYMKEDNAANTSGLDSLLSAQNIQTNVDIWGSTETDNEGQPNVLPIYAELNVGGSVEVCTVTAFGSNNKLGNRRYVKLNIPANGTYTLRLTPSETSDLDAFVFTNGTYITGTQAAGTSVVNLSMTLEAGVSIAETLAYNAAGNALMATCYDVELLN